MLLINYTPVLRQPTGIGVYANAVLPALQALPHWFVPGGEREPVCNACGVWCGTKRSFPGWRAAKGLP